MTEILFYHLERSTLFESLPPLLAKIFERGLRSVVRLGNAARLVPLDEQLWRWNPDGFLPHGHTLTSYAKDQPIWLTCEPENPNNATILVLCEDATMLPQDDSFDRICMMFDGQNDTAVQKARALWAQAKEQGHRLSYWQQGERGGWDKKAEV